jgi:hypothetical protein
MLQQACAAESHPWNCGCPAGKHAEEMGRGTAADTLMGTQSERVTYNDSVGAQAKKLAGEVPDAEIDRQAEELFANRISGNTTASGARRDEMERERLREHARLLAARGPGNALQGETADIAAKLSGVLPDNPVSTGVDQREPLMTKVMVADAETGEFISGSVRMYDDFRLQMRFRDIRSVADVT